MKTSVGRLWIYALVASGIAGLFGALVVDLRATAQRQAVARAMTRGDPALAADPIRRYGCAGCHAIPGVPGADGQVGPSLAGLRQRVYLAGHLRNTPDALLRWIVAPQSVDPGTAMPVTGIGETDARNVAAYLYAQ